MRTIHAKELSLEAFYTYGSYRSITDPEGPNLGEAPVDFFRDLIQQPLGRSTIASFSNGRFWKRDPVIDVCECHSECGEAFIPLDADVLLQVAPATMPDDPPFDDFVAFRILRGTLVVLRPGVWHHAPFVIGAEVVNTLYILPERAYATDGVTHRFPPEKRVRIKWAG